MSALKRDIGPGLQKLRTFLLGREHVQALRFEDGLADRTQPPPDIPGGSAHNLSANYYCNRDPRREVAPPIDVATQLLSSGDSSSASGKPPIPGKVWNY